MLCVYSTRALEFEGATSPHCTKWVPVALERGRKLTLKSVVL